MTQQSKIGVKETIENLIKTATSFDVNKLESIYHDNIQVIMIDPLGQKTISDKQTFMNLFKSKRDNGDAPLNTWAEFNHIEHNGNKGHVVLKRKVNLTGMEQKIALSIDLIWEENRWQVTREVIFAQFD
ncbi:hypothetical protein [Zobellia sp. 1_MG-2023]|uniref:hypothetical protein n=1 Tax=Zobellia sp. 1_MG-2023 TaxID=3062626 RepID=UPI0026E45582|nr:hypothetical protein [Zobellia sp. 1_MG-2023]MDO6820716.1 hypothetical protein [Zobellia sp. 1_MG-2023]